MIQMGPAASVMQEIPDSLVSPFPSVAALSRWFFSVPQAVQIAGVVVAAVLVVSACVWLWRHRVSTTKWISSRSLKLQISLAILGVSAFFAVAAFGVSSYSYTQHSNDFCQSCHVMDSAFARFAESEHADRGCHDCHQQAVTASLRQVYSWVLERPDEIGAHAPVPNAVCSNCHITEDPDSTWQRISATAGHRVHLESDSTALQEALCVTCHGLEIHQFVPNRETCGQSECHDLDERAVILGSMANDSTAYHCVVCHEFTAPLDEGGNREAAFSGLVPRTDQCSACHEMEDLLASLDVDQDPHGGVCADCHNPHTQGEPAEAFESCGTSGCHEDPQAVSPFHRDQHAAVEGCGTCHEPHAWTAPTTCSACHETPP